ncbi:hypothetical protein V5O48_008132 [Marasmius crinis-equi]|uniref:NAD(P)-binding domain-containing protein n=1 Tax=Marasmius crinis-equi TaxID=585013 RepID=A0ABR3FFA8_9AGAR
MNAFVIGGSKNIGYLSALRLLAAGSTVTFLLRNTSCFDEDERIQRFVSTGRAFLFKGDALVRSDVEKGWEAAEKNGNGKVDLLLFTVGGAPSFSLTKGIITNPINLVTQCFLNVLSTMPKSTPGSPQTKIVAVSVAGSTKSARSALPLAPKALYSTFMKSIIRDKLGLERLVHHSAGWKWTHGEVSEEILPTDWERGDSIPRFGSLEEVLVVRPAILTDGKCVGDEDTQGEPPYRVSEEDFKAWTVSREDVAHFIADAVLNRWQEYRNKHVTIGY